MTPSHQAESTRSLRQRPRMLQVLCAAAAAGLALAGCQSSPDAAATASPSASAATQAAQEQQHEQAACSALAIDSEADTLPTVSDDAEPTLSWSGGEAPENLTVSVLRQGSGPEVGEHDLVSTNYAGWQWKEDQTFDSSYDRGAPVAFSLQEVIHGWTCGMAGHHVGDRLLLSIPADLAYGDDASSSGAPTGPLVFVVDILDAQSVASLTPGTAEATMDDDAVAAMAAKGVTVSGDLGAPAQISVDAAAAEPQAIEVTVIARGAGRELTANDTLGILAAFSSWDGSHAQSGWEENYPQALPLITQGPLQQALIGVPLGSRVVALLPGSGQAGSTSYAYVIDLDAVVAQQ